MSRIPLFDRDQLKADIVQAQADYQLAQVREVQEEEPSWPAKARLDHLETLLRMSDVVDLGQPVPPNDPRHLTVTKDHPVLNCDAPDPRYIMPDRAYTAHLCQNFTHSGEAALSVVYRAEHGAALIQYGYRYATSGVFVVSNKHDPHNYFDAEEFLRQFAMRHWTVGFNDAVIRDIPVRMPLHGDVSAHGVKLDNIVALRDSVRAWVNTFLPKSDGFIRWGEPGCENVGRLMFTEWWKEKLF